MKYNVEKDSIETKSDIDASDWSQQQRELTNQVNQKIDQTERKILSDITKVIKDFSQLQKRLGNSNETREDYAQRPIQNYENMFYHWIGVIAKQKSGL